MVVVPAAAAEEQGRNRCGAERPPCPHQQGRRRLGIARRVAGGDLPFLNHLEQDRGNTTRTRNASLAAIHSLYKYAAFGTQSTWPRSAG